MPLHLRESTVLGALKGIHPNQDRVAAVRNYPALTCRFLSPQEKRYPVTELETLAVIWAVSHFHAYLYGHNVQVFTDHSAVKAVLETPSPNGKHARWWTKIFGSGVKKLLYHAVQYTEPPTRCRSSSGPEENHSRAVRGVLLWG